MDLEVFFDRVAKKRFFEVPSKQRGNLKTSNGASRAPAQFISWALQTSQKVLPFLENQEQENLLQSDSG
jgi:hypothetical protein